MSTLVVDGIERPMHNSLGQRIHATDAGIVNFWRWFGDSPAVDAHGRPLTVYHGTTRDLLQFAPRPNGACFTSELEYTYDFAGPYGWIIPVYVALRNPLCVEAPLGFEREEGIPLGASMDFYDAHWSQGQNAFLLQARQEGRDGVLVRCPRDVLVIALSPEQVKSAMGNSGRFDPSSPLLNDLPGTVRRLAAPVAEEVSP